MSGAKRRFFELMEREHEHDRRTEAAAGALPCASDQQTPSDLGDLMAWASDIDVPALVQLQRYPTDGARRIASYMLEQRFLADHEGKLRELATEKMREREANAGPDPDAWHDEREAA